jgi:hypothetical protein
VDTLRAHIPHAQQQDFQLATRHRLHTTDDFWFEVDEYIRGAGRVEGDQMLIAHVRVERWSPSVCRECHRIWDAFRTCVTAPVFTIGMVDDDKFERFVLSFGYEPFQVVTCLNGEQRRLFIHRIKEKASEVEHVLH